MRTLAPLLAATSLLSSLAFISSKAHAAPVFVGDLETGDVSQFSGTLNGQNITVVTNPVSQGLYAARIELTNDAIWPNNGLKRVELRHSPAAPRTAEGATTCFAWSLYLPEELPTDPSQQIGYWESGQSYQQMMAFSAEGTRIRFATRKPTNQTLWSDDNALTTAQWHRIAMCLVWSKQTANGSVEIWFDNQQVVAPTPSQTLNDDNPHFTQIGLLRGAIEFADAPVIMIDDVVEGDTLADVRPDALEQGAGGGGQGGSGQGGAASSTSSAATGGASNGATSATSGAGGGGGDGSDSADDGCSCRTGSAGDGGGDQRGAGFGLLAALGLWVFTRRARSSKPSA